MAEKRKFDIAFVGLKQGVHKFTYELDKKFFVEKGSEDFSDLVSTVQLSIEKETGFMRLKFEVGGKAEVACDRCGNPLKLDLWDEFNIIVKLVENPEEMNLNEEDPDIFYISRTESYLHVSDLLYEFVLLSLPMQRMCTLEEMGGPQCNLEVLNKLKDMERKEVEHNANALWKGLDKFKDN